MKRITSWILALLLSGTTSSNALAQQQSGVISNGLNIVAAPGLTGTARVTAINGRFSVSADRSDVRDVIRLVFDQANRQFNLDSNVIGQVTLRLQNQPLQIVLDTICRQIYAKYSTNTNTIITLIERDDEAVKAAIERLQALDGDLRNQLRAIGLSLPPDNNLGLAFSNQLSTNRAYPNITLPSANNGTRGLGGFAGGGGAPSGDSPNNQPGSPNSSRSGLNYGRTNTKEKPTEDVRSRRISPVDGGATANLLEKPDTKPSADQTSQFDDLAQQNHFVSFKVPDSDPVPVVEVLKSLATQANVAMLIDPSIPNNNKFVIKRGSMSPRPLADALNLIAPFARLEWRWVGQSIYVTQSPDFEVLFGANAPLSYGPQVPLKTQAKKAAEPAAPSKQNPPKKEK